MKRFLLGAATMAAVFVLVSFIPAPAAPAPQTPGQIERVVVHDGSATFVWEMSGTEVAGLMVFSLESAPSTEQAVVRRHFSVREGKK
jgi:hypothetical protein